MSETVTVEAGPPADGEAKVAEVREGLAALDACLATTDPREIGSEERNEIVAIVLSVDGTLRELEAWSGNGAKVAKPRRQHRLLRLGRAPRKRSQSAPIKDASADGATGAPADGEHIPIDEEYRADLAARVAALRAELDERAGKILVLTTAGEEKPKRRLGALFGSITATPKPTAAATTSAGTAASTRPAPLLSRRSIERSVGKVLTAAGVIAVLFLAFEFGLTGTLEARDQRALLLEFQSAIVTTTLDQPNKTIPPGSAVALLNIPSIHVSQVVVEGTINRLLKRGPGHLSAAPLPGEFGNAILEGHRTKYGAPFRNLNLLHTGDRMMVTTGQGLFIYVVIGVYHLRSGDSDVFASSADSRLTLVSADPPQGASGRIVAVGILQGSPVAIASRPPQPVGRNELGLAADPMGAFLGLIWLQLFVVAYLAARRLRRNWHPTVTYLLSAPILLALLLQVFINVDLLLPGTL
jgi:LPXTG-site transpeptidase (sortase) family protein